MFINLPATIFWIDKIMFQVKKVVFRNNVFSRFYEILYPNLRRSLLKVVGIVVNGSF